MENPVRETTLYVVNKADQVRINREKIEKAAQKWAKGKLLKSKWPKNYHFKSQDRKKTLDYLIILDALNFCFWSKDKKWNIKYGESRYDGYYGLSLALKKFFKKHPEKANLEYFSSIPFKEFAFMLRGRGDLAFMKKRWDIVRAVCGSLLKKYKDSEDFVESANQRFSNLSSQIYNDLPFFNDISYYKGRKIYFLKRAQILCSDIWGSFSGKGIGYFKDPEYLTAFADYKIPQVLFQLGILKYSASLREKIEKRGLVLKGSKDEVEIRSCTVWAVEYLAEEINKKGKDFYPFQIDWLLWNKSQKMKLEKPYHLTKTIFY